MNIIVKPYGSKSCYCRPDTTWERENKDFYVPECVTGLNWSPIIFVRISKAGKCISDRFASRYYDAFNYGALLYCHTEDASDIASASCFDHTSLLPAPLYNLVVMENEDNVHEVMKNGEPIFRTSGTISGKEMIEEAICLASRKTSLRIGDYIAVELAPQSLLASRPEGDIRIDACFCENSLYSMKLIF